MCAQCALFVLCIKSCAWSNLKIDPKDSFHDYVIHGHSDAVNPKKRGTKVAAYHVFQIPAQCELYALLHTHIHSLTLSHICTPASVTIRMRLYSTPEEEEEDNKEEDKKQKKMLSPKMSPFGSEFERIFAERIAENGGNEC